MNVLLSHGYFLYEDEKEQKIMRPYPPLGILYISAWLDRHNIQNTVYDTTFSTKKDALNYIIQNPPEIIALYTNLMTKLNIIDMIGELRQHNNTKDSIIVLGGPDVRYNAQDYLNVGVDIIVKGEGEQTMLQIVQTIEAGNRSEFAHIEGVVYYSASGECIETGERAHLKSVDELPTPNRSKIDMQPYLDTWKKYHGQSAMTVSTQRGCPYTCKWCSTAVYGQSYRRRSPALVAQELKMLKDTYQPDSIWFVDDVFTVSHKWLEAFVKEVNTQDAVIPFECITRADRMNDKVIQWLKEAGCFRVWIGAESGSQKIIDAMDRRVDVQVVRQMIQQTRASGMQAGTFIMLGYPGETEDDIKETIHHLKTANPDLFTITIAYPIKGTSLYNEIESQQLNDIDWNTSTDRDRDFKRTYSRRYYEYAVKWVTNEVLWYKERVAGKGLGLDSLKYKVKAIAANTMMSFNRT